MCFCFKSSSDSCKTIANNEAIWEKMLPFWDEIIKLQRLCRCTETGGGGCLYFRLQSHIIFISFTSYCRLCLMCLLFFILIARRQYAGTRSQWVQFVSALQTFWGFCFVISLEEIKSETNFIQTDTDKLCLVDWLAQFNKSLLNPAA